MDGKNSFVLYCDVGQHLALLSDEDAGKLFKAVVWYADTGATQELPPMAEMAFSFLRAQIDRDKEKWLTVREKRRIAGRAGGLKSGEARSNETNEANASFAKQNQANEPVNVPVPVPVNAPVSVINRENNAGKPPRPRFTPPSEDDALAFFSEQGASEQEAQAFHDFYTANGWQVGKNKMRDWKAAARNWIRRSAQYAKQPIKAAAVQQSATDAVARAAERLANGDFSALEGVLV